MKVKWVILGASAAFAALWAAAWLAHSRGESPAGEPAELLNVSYDPTRELYKEVGERFAAFTQARTGKAVRVLTSHGGSGAQARAVLGGLKADLVTLALAYDIDALAERGWVRPDWATRFENHSSPCVSTIVFLVRKGNPKKLLSWDDVIRPGTSVITPNPKTSGNGRWSFLAAWGHAAQGAAGEKKAFEFVKALYERVPVLDTGARGSTTTFVQKKIGDVLLAWENEALLAQKEAGPDAVEIVYPEDSVLAEPPVAVVDRNVDARGTRALAEEFIRFLYSEDAQDIIARAGYRPVLPSVLERYRSRFPPIRRLWTVRDLAGSWKEAHQKFFAEGGVFDQIYRSQ
jgi:sulfate transport system substrate-binding protein